jgi:uncharacterized membrane protein YeaQ/YmgE (transglycosylase-associated protein family)
MWLIFIWLIVGGAAGGGTHWFMENRSGLGNPMSIVIGLIAGAVGGYLFLMFGTLLVNEGVLPIVSFLAAAVFSAVVVIIASLLKK